MTRGSHCNADTPRHTQSRVSTLVRAAGWRRVGRAEGTCERDRAPARGVVCARLVATSEQAPAARFQGPPSLGSSWTSQLPRLPLGGTGPAWGPASSEVQAAAEGRERANYQHSLGPRVPLQQRQHRSHWGQGCPVTCSSAGRLVHVTHPWGWGCRDPWCLIFSGHVPDPLGHTVHSGPPISAASTHGLKI